MAFNGFMAYQAVPVADTAIPLNGYFRSFEIWTDSGSADIYVALNNAPASIGGANCFRIQAGRVNGYRSPDNANIQLSSFHVIGATATGNMNIIAM